MLPLGFIIFPYFIYLISKKIYEKSFLLFFLYGFSYGFGFLIIYLSWIHNPFLIFQTTTPYAILSILLPIFLSLFFGLCFIIFKKLKNPVLRILLTPVIFTFIEFLISNFFYGFPWVSNALILSNNLLGFYIIKYFGTLTSGFLIISIFLLPTYFLYKSSIITFRKLILFIYSPFLFFLLISVILVFFNNNNLSKEISIEAYQILSPINKQNTKEIEQNILNIINKSESEYIVFGENNFPYLIDKNNYNNISNFIKNEKKIIIGGTTYNRGEYFNSFILLEKDQILFFDKKILVPFGEFLPFRKYLKFMEYISGSNDFEIGKIDRILITKDNLKILPIICYEIIFDQIFKNIDKKQIDILINITNDSWFGTKIGPYQHFYITRIKSLIANKPLVRVSNNGISAIINSNGKIIKSSKLNQISKLTHKLKIKNDKSFLYFHKFFSYYLLCIFLLLLIFLRNNKNAK